MIEGVQEILFQVHGDERGSLVAIENWKDIDFEMKRIYFIYGTSPDAVRGKHAHRNLKQVLLCVHGQCDVLLDNGKEQEIVTLNEADKGIYLTGFVWREMMHFSKGCVLIAIVDQEYDPQDYIYDRDLLRNKGGKHT